MKTRLMKPADFPKLFKLWQEAGLQLRDLRREKKEVLTTVKMNKSSCFVIEEKGLLLGSILGTFNGRRGWIYRQAINPDYQRKGYGTLLMNKAEKTLKKLGATRVLLGVWMEDKEVIRFYQKNGYSIIDDSVFLGKNLE